MNKKQENKATMYQTVKRTHKQHEGILPMIPIYYEGVMQFNSLMADLSIQRRIQEREDLGVTMDKTKVKEVLAKQANRVSNALVAYGTQTHNHTLAESMRVTVPHLMHERDTTMLEHCRRILDATIGLESVLIPYGVTDTVLSDLVIFLDDFELLVTAPRNATGERMAAKFEIERLMGEIDLLLQDVLDKLIVQFEVDYPAFVKEYKSARVIIDLGVRHEKPEEPSGDVVVPPVG